MTSLDQRIESQLEALRAAGTLKTLQHLTTATGPTTTIEGVGEVVVFCSNNYLGLANHPEVVRAGIFGLEQFGAGTASVRFICGTFACHRTLEERLAGFLGTQAALTYVSCWNANEGLIPTLVESGDVILSDELNHASIIDACRLARAATRKVYRHSDMHALGQQLDESAAAPVKLVVTDGVFSMEGDIANLPEIVALCRRYHATLIVDDSHGVGVLGARGRGTFEHFSLAPGQLDGMVILTGTLGKALGGAAGGYVAASRNVVDLLIQRSRPQLFSNALPPTVACSANKAIEILEHEPERIARLRQNVKTMRDGLCRLGYHTLNSPTAIIPIIIGDTAAAIRSSMRLLQLGVFVIGFGFPVVPEGTARLRIQMSAAHTREHIDYALAAFAKLKDELPENQPASHQTSR
jgi:glycine C-acetyltransferase